MKTKLLLFLCIMCLCSCLYGQTERECQDIIHEQIGGVKEFVLDDGTRVDILLPNRAIEIDWQDKWAEAIGQSTYYSLKTNRPPAVILLIKDDNYEKYVNRVQYCGIECWTYNIETEELIK